MTIDAALVRALLDAQCPRLAGGALVDVGCGWDNHIFRLGSDLAVRLPRRAAAAALIEHEQHWLPRLAPRLPLRVPMPVHAGRPAGGFPWSWSVVRWLPGVPAASASFDEEDAADHLAAFLRELHRPAPPNAPRNPLRGVPLAERRVSVERYVAATDPFVDPHSVRSAWDRSAQARAWPGPPLWIHGDLHPANMLVHDSRLSAVIDFGDLTAGDPATDLSVGWTLFSEHGRRRFRARLDESHDGLDDDTWIRARGWALILALAFLAVAGDHETFSPMGRRALDAVIADG